MPQILPQPEDIILEKLESLKCCKNCQNLANYLIFGFGLYCTQCIAKVQNVTPDQIVQFQKLSAIMVQLIQEYQKNTRSQVSFVKVSKTQTDKANMQIQKLKKNLNYEISNIKNRYNELINHRYKKCLAQHTLQSLQALYEPDMTATIVMNETQLLLKNLQILKIQQKQNNQLQYKFVDQSKHPKEVYKQCSQQYVKFKNVLQSATQKVKGTIENWKVQNKKQ